MEPDGSPELAHEPEALARGPDGERSRPQVLLEFWDEPPGCECAEGGLGVSVGADRDRDRVLSDAEIGAERVLCRAPTAPRCARSL
jgi:hypothetical protein